ncbi:MAG: hypothetical protein LBO09_04810 [Candidatus Peribacteria bacterium]|jgi:hypothetical protein|nr:hypothetical protein [Candidatus Peribacteria bacterium]
MNISSRPSFHNVCSTVLLGTALFMGGEFETVKATTFALGETLEASAPTFSPVEPVTLEQKETLEAKLPALTAKVMISFCEEEMKVKFSEEEKVKITQRLTQFFKKSPICCIENGKIKLLMTATYTDAAAKELMPYFVNKVD